jgi:hypothetical protein
MPLRPLFVLGALGRWRSAGAAFSPGPLLRSRAQFTTSQSRDEIAIGFIAKSLGSASAKAKNRVKASPNTALSKLRMDPSEDKLREDTEARLNERSARFVAGCVRRRVTDAQGGASGVAHAYCTCEEFDVKKLHSLLDPLGPPLKVFDKVCCRRNHPEGP